METWLKGAALIAALMFVFVLANQAAAETLGSKIAATLCYDSETHSYSLSFADLAEWRGMEVTGSYAGEDHGIVVYEAKFYKSANNDTEGKCTKRKVESSSDCKQWSVTNRDGWSLLKSPMSESCR